MSEFTKIAISFIKYNIISKIIIINSLKIYLRP